MDPIIVDATRGEVVEARHRIHAVVVRGDEIVLSAGDPELVVFLRSSAKPIQALPLVRARPDLDDEQIAIAQTMREELASAAGTQSDDMPASVDGCGVLTVALPLVRRLGRLPACRSWTVGSAWWEPCSITRSSCAGPSRLTCCWRARSTAGPPRAEPKVSSAPARVTGSAWRRRHAALQPRLVTVEPHEGLELHLHGDEDDSFYVLEGELTFTVEDEEIVAGAGAFILVPPGVRHTFANRGNTPVRMVNVHAPAGFDERLEKG